MISLKENITKNFLKEFEERKNRKNNDEDEIDGNENSKDFYFNVPTDVHRLQLCHDFQEKKIDKVTKLLIKEKKPMNKFASLKKLFKNGNKENKSSTRQFVQQLSPLLTVEYREKKQPQVNKKIQNIFARLRKSKVKSVDEIDAISTIDGNTMSNENPEKIILAERKQIVSKIDEISELIKDYLEEQQLADLTEEKLNDFLKELVAAYIP